MSTLRGVLYAIMALALIVAVLCLINNTQDVTSLPSPLNDIVGVLPQEGSGAARVVTFGSLGVVALSAMGVSGLGKMAKGESRQRW